jgi:hypothetical protein
MRPRRLHATATVVLLSAAACGGAGSASSAASGSSSAPATTTTSPAGTGAPVSSEPPASGGAIELPEDAPIAFDSNVDANDLPFEDLVPPGANVGATWVGSITTTNAHESTSAAVVAWSRGDLSSAESGLEIWERFDTTVGDRWRVAYAFTDPAGSDVLGVRFETGDVTGDRSPDVLSFEDVGGSGACGIWRVIRMNVGAEAEIWRRRTCDTVVRIVDGALDVRAAVYAPEDAHCCPSAFRSAKLRWNGAAWDVVERSTEPA